MSTLINETVASDGDAVLAVWCTDNTPKGNFNLVLGDGGGYSSILMNKEVWEQMKKDVDKHFEEWQNLHVKPS